MLRTGKLGNITKNVILETCYLETCVERGEKEGERERARYRSRGWASGPVARRIADGSARCSRGPQKRGAIKKIGAAGASPPCPSHCCGGGGPLHPVGPGLGRRGPGWAGGGRGPRGGLTPRAVAMATPAEPSRGAGARPCERSYRLNEIFIVLFFFNFFFNFFLRAEVRWGGRPTASHARGKYPVELVWRVAVMALRRPQERVTRLVRLFSGVQTPLCTAHRT